MSVEFLWGEPAAPKRGPKPALTLEVIADAAVTVADAEGLAAVSMQRVAADLGYTKMSLYRYLPGKAELVALMVERAIGEPPALLGAGWRESLEQWTRLVLERFSAHPWAVAATAGSRPLGPYEMGWMEVALARMAGLPLRGAEQLDTVAVLAGHGRMLAQQSKAMPAEAMPAEAGMVEAMGEVMRVHGGRFPHVLAAMADQDNADQAFEYGLARILDGVEQLVRLRS